MTPVELCRMWGVKNGAWLQEVKRWQAAEAKKEATIRKWIAATERANKSLNDVLFLLTFLSEPLSREQA